MPGDSTASLRFPRSRRVKLPGDFARARAKGRRLVSGCLVVNILPRAGGPETRLGVVTSKKVGSAVARSRARRLLREVFRLHQNEVKAPADWVLVANPSIARKKLADVERDFLRVLKQAQPGG